MTGRFTGSRIVRCIVASSDCPNRKSRKVVSPQIKVTASRGYVPRLTVESNTKTRENIKSDEETRGTYNRLLSTDSAEWIGRTEAETAAVDLSQNISSSSLVRKVDAADEEEELTGNAFSIVARGDVDGLDEYGVEEDIFEMELSGFALSSTATGEVLGVDEASVEQDMFVSSSGTMRVVDAVDEAGATQDTSEADLSRNVPDGATMVEVNAVDEAGAVQDTFQVDLSEIVSVNATRRGVEAVDEAWDVQDAFETDFSINFSSSATMGEVDVDEVGSGEETYEADLAGNVSSSTTAGEVDAIDEQGSDQETFEVVEVDLPGNLPSSATYGNIDVVDETRAEEVILEMDLSSASRSAGLWGVDEVDEAKAEEETFEMVLPGSVSGNATHIAVEYMGEAIVEEEQYPSLSSQSLESKAIDRTPPSSNIEPLVGIQEQGKPFFSVHEEEGSVMTFHEKIQPMLVIHEQKQMIIDFDKHIQPIATTPKQNQSITGCPKQNLSIVAFHKQDLSITGPHKQQKSIIGVPKQVQSIVGSGKQHQLIVAFRKQDQSIVSVPQPKQSIVGFRKQDLSIVGFRKENLSITGTLDESQTTQVTVVGRHDALHEAKDGDHTYRKTSGGALHVKFDADNLFQKHKADSAKEVVEMKTSNEVDGEHLSMTEDQINVPQEQTMVAKDRLSMAEVGTRIGEKNAHLISAKKLWWAEDKVVLIKDNEKYQIDATSTPVEPDVQELPPYDVEPLALRRMVQELADKNDSLGNKLFTFPDVVKADSIIDLYLKRDLTALASEPDVLIKGAFNGWRWRHFTGRLHKSELHGDWWSFKLHIPKEAYRLDFVFFNGRSVYENNGNNDFVMQIESTMDEDLFDNFLVEEKQREHDRLAIEEDKMRRQTKEQRRREEERAAEEAIRAQAKAEVKTKKNKLHNMLGFARTHADNLWYIEPRRYNRRDTVRLYYNRNLRPVVHSTEIWMHGGYNSWTDGLSIVERLVKCDDKDGDWWYADVVLPEKAFVLDWVFADGPPANARNYDNNGRQDFHAILPNIKIKEEYWVEEEQSIYSRLLQERRVREEAIKKKAERSAIMKAEMKAKTMRRFLLSQKHIVYTEPLEICAGTTVDVLYNPSNTVLNGKPEVWFRCSFNLWMHSGGALPPQKMLKTEDGSLLKATVRVPPDAYMMDFVFSESEDGGIYDNRNGMDYHIPISGSIATETRMHIIHIAVEMAPIAKVGGLGDVVTSLSRAVQDLGHAVEVILPKYDCLSLSSVKNLHLHRSFSWGGTEIKVWFGLVEGLSVYFLEPQNGMFGVGCVYGRNDDRRFGFFCHSALEFLLQSGSSPHIIHCHDWSSAPVAWLYKEHYAQSRLASARVVFTIHNLEFGAHYIGKTMTYCDKATTVSHTYSREVAGHGAIAPHRGKFYGILNGIDPDIWDPYTDNYIPAPYTSENVVEGKNAAKRALQQKLGLQQTDVPIVGIVTRLTAQKGIHLIKYAIHRTLESNGQVVLLGSAPDHRIQGDFCRLADSLHGVYHGRVKLVLTYDEPLSHLIYAGSDFILVPSIFEPCGLTQLVAMRYGSIPIVRKTGGLYDTVFDVDHDKDRARSLGIEPNGFSFDGADCNGVDYSLNRAISAWFDARDWFHSLCKRVMEQDWSWNRPALDYIELYHSARKF